MRKAGPFTTYYHEGTVRKCSKEGWVTEIVQTVDPVGAALNLCMAGKALLGINVRLGILLEEHLETHFPLKNTEVVTVPTTHEQQVEFLERVEELFSQGTVEIKGIVCTKVLIPYQLLFNNCQHTSRKLAQGKSTNHVSEETKCLGAAIAVGGAVVAKRALTSTKNGPTTSKAKKAGLAVAAAVVVIVLMYVAFLNLELFHDGLAAAAAPAPLLYACGRFGADSRTEIVYPI